MIKKKEEELNKISRRRVKVIEKTGTQLQRILTKSDPWGEGCCERVDCLPCASNTKTKGNCRRINTVYENTCLLCKETGSTRLYIGETSRSTYRRGSEHLRDLLNSSEKSHMHQHIVGTHPELIGQLTTAKEVAGVFSMKPVRKHMNSLSRQLHEAIKIIRAGDSTLNNKEEYSRCYIPTLSTSHQNQTRPNPVEAEQEPPVHPEPPHKNKRPRTRSEARPGNKRFKFNHNLTAGPSPREAEGTGTQRSQQEPDQEPKAAGEPTEPRRQSEVEPRVQDGARTQISQ